MYGQDCNEAFDVIDPMNHHPSIKEYEGGDRFEILTPIVDQLIGLRTQRRGYQEGRNEGAEGLGGDGERSSKEDASKKLLLLLVFF